MERSTIFENGKPSCSPSISLGHRKNHGELLVIARRIHPHPTLCGAACHWAPPQLWPRLWKQSRRTCSERCVGKRVDWNTQKIYEHLKKYMKNIWNDIWTYNYTGPNLYRFCNFPMLSRFWGWLPISQATGRWGMFENQWESKMFVAFPDMFLEFPSLEFSFRLRLSEQILPEKLQWD